MTTTTDELVYRYVATRAHCATTEGGSTSTWPRLVAADRTRGSPKASSRAPQTAARALLLVANVAGARFWTPPNMVAAAIEAADPVVTTSNDGAPLRVVLAVLRRLRAVRLGRRRARRHRALARHHERRRQPAAPVGARPDRGLAIPCTSRVGHDELAVSTLDGRVVEKTRAAPRALGARASPRSRSPRPPSSPSFELCERGLASVPPAAAEGRKPRRALGRAVRHGSEALDAASAGSVAVGGIERLRVLREMAPFIRVGDRVRPSRRAGRARTRARAPCGRSTSKVATSRSALSPEPSRGFSVRAVCSTHPRHGVDAKVEAAAAAGRLGYDVRRAEWFPRELPVQPSHPRQT